MTGKSISPNTLKEFFKNAKGFERVLEKLNVTSIGGGKCVCEMKVEEEHTNSMGTLHGGLSATLVDSLSSYALMSQKVSVPNVSVNMNISYLKGVKKGEEIIVDAKTIRAGKYLAFLEVDIRSKQSGETLVTSTHTKFLMQ